MKNYERRASGNTVWFKLATWEDRSYTWKDGRIAFGSEAEARAAARKPGKYRVSRVVDGARTDLEPFTVA